MKKKIVAIIVSFIMMVTMATSVFAGTIEVMPTIDNTEFIDGGMEEMPTIKIPDNYYYYYAVMVGKYKVSYNVGAVNDAFKVAKSINKPISQLTNRDLLLTVTDKKDDTYTNANVVIKCKETKQGNIKVTIKKVGNKRVNKKFIIKRG